MEAARWVLGELPADRLPDLAVQALQHGIETESVVRLAGLHRPIAAEAGPLFESVLRELGEPIPTRDDAVWALVYETANLIVRAITPPGKGAKRLTDLARQLDPVPERLLVFVGLESELEDFSDATRIAFYGAEHCASVRGQIERSIIEAAANVVSERAG